MREIKFRAWNLKEKRMWVEVGIDAGVAIIDTHMGLMPLKGENILMQYTGLKDKNGKEIYEGDILKTVSELMTHFGERGTGKYRTEFYSIEYDETNARFKERKIETGYLLPLGLSQDIISKYSEVIGNIYENPGSNPC